MTSKSAKAKGRRLAQKIVDKIAEKLRLTKPEQIHPTPSGVTGSDVTMSLGAKAVFPYDVEAKNVERLNIWEAIAQVEKRRSPDMTPLVVFSRNGEKIYAVVEFDHFLDLVAVYAG